jgi:CBS domain-containing protein
MKVRELYTPHLVKAHPGEDLSVAASRMQFHEVGALAVYDAGTLVGILTERDVLRAVGDGRVPELTTVAEFMSPEPITVTPEIEVGQAAGLMLSLGARHLPVTEAGELVGMLSARDILSIEAGGDLVAAAEGSWKAALEGRGDGTHI